MACPYPKPDADVVVVRPFRIWDAKAKKHVVGRQYASLRNTHNGALLLVRWEAIGHALEVYDVTTGSLKGQYFRTLTGVKFINVKE